MTLHAPPAALHQEGTIQRGSSQAFVGLARVYQDVELLFFLSLTWFQLMT